jgi:hypothetical protein
MQALADVECLVGPSASMGIEEIALQFYLDRYLGNTDFVNFRHILNLPGLLPGASRNYKSKLVIEEFVREGRYYFPKPVTGEEECGRSGHAGPLFFGLRRHARHQLTPRGLATSPRPQRSASVITRRTIPVVARLCSCGALVACTTSYNMTTKC